jgi:uncharacterized protein (TIGR02246 family)
MKNCCLAVAGLLLVPLVGSSTVCAQAPANAAARGGDEVAIRSAARQFAEAFNRSDAKAIAAQWLEDGSYIDEDGVAYSGRAAIEAEYAKFFKEQPGLKVQVTVDSVKLLSPDAALEEGRVTLDPRPAGAAGLSKYTAVHVKRNGSWLMATVRDDRIGPPAATNKLPDLEWMIGDWRAEELGVAAEVSCRWLGAKSFLQRSYRVGSGESATSGEQVIGWNAQFGCLQSWTFGSDGGHSVGLWTEGPKRWTIEAQGMTASGAPTTAIITLVPLDRDAFAWQSASRTVAGSPLADTDEIVFKRRPMKP